MKQSKTFASGFPVEETIETLRQQLAEKDALISRLQFALADTETLELGTAARLAAAESREQQLREAVGLWIGIATNCSIESGCCHCGDSMENHASPFSCGHSPVDMADSAVYNAIKKSDEAISLPSDTTALEAMIAKAGEVMRKQCVDLCDRFAAREMHPAECAGAIRALPGVTLEDLKC